MEKASRTILIVEDDEKLRNILNDLISPYVEHVILASHGQEALDIIKEQIVDTVLSDIDMPIMDGLTLLREIRELDLDTPFIILTGAGDKDKAIEALRLGAIDFQEKPLQEDKLLDSVNNAIKIGFDYRNIKDEIDKVCRDFQGNQKEKDKLRNVYKALIKIKIERKNIATGKSKS